MTPPGAPSAHPLQGASSQKPDPSPGVQSLQGLSTSRIYPEDASGPAPPVPRYPLETRRLVPAVSFAPEVLLLAQGRGLGLKAAIFDVDGVLTDGRLYIGEHGETVKAFSTLDGQGLKLLVAGGIEPLIITGRDSAAVRRRVADLGLKHAVYGAHDKLAAATMLLASLGMDWEDTGAMGDDWPDLPLLVRAAFACAPANAHADAKAAAHHVTAAAGGHGAAREFCDLLLLANGRYGGLLRAQSQTLDAR